MSKAQARMVLRTSGLAFRRRLLVALRGALITAPEGGCALPLKRPRVLPPTVLPRADGRTGDMSAPAVLPAGAKAAP